MFVCVDIFSVWESKQAEVDGSRKVFLNKFPNTLWKSMFPYVGVHCNVYYLIDENTLLERSVDQPQQISQHLFALFWIKTICDEGISRSPDYWIKNDYFRKTLTSALKTFSVKMDYIYYFRKIAATQEPPINKLTNTTNKHP